MKRNQQGMSLIFLVFLIGLGITGLIVATLPNGNFQIGQAVVSNQVMQEAKAAVIGIALTSLTGTAPNPGKFPCPENTTLIGTFTEGQEDLSCSTAVSIGRVAWKTLGIGEIRDGNAERLWYALSSGFRPTSIGVPKINSNTTPTLNIDGVQNKAIAILFSPGTVLSGQSRATPSAPIGPSVANYLDGENNDGDADFITGPISSNFNDKLVIIGPDDIFPVIEKRVLREIKNYVNEYKAIWGAYPFPAQFLDPSNTGYAPGAIPVEGLGGWLPVNNSTVIWQSVTCLKDGLPCDSPCVVTASSFSCPTSFSSSIFTVITISAKLKNVGLGFYKGLDRSDFSVNPSASVSLGYPSHQLNSDGSGTVNITVLAAGSGSVTTSISKVPSAADWVGALMSSNWIIQNDWHKLIYYKVARPFLPGGAGLCGLCLTVNKINVSPNTLQTGVHALLMSPGRRLDSTNAMPAPTYGASNPAQTRPPGNLITDYFDSANNIAAGLSFDTASRPLDTFNDQVEIVE